MLSLRKPECVTAARLKGLITTILDALFAILDTLVNNLRIKDNPERFYNLAETGISLHPKDIKTLLPKRIEKFSICCSIRGETMFTVLLGGNAAGAYFFLSILVCNDGKGLRAYSNGSKKEELRKERKF